MCMYVKSAVAVELVWCRKNARSVPDESVEVPNSKISDMRYGVCVCVCVCVVCVCVCVCVVCMFCW